MDSVSVQAGKDKTITVNGDLTKNDDRVTDPFKNAEKNITVTNEVLNSLSSSSLNPIESVDKVRKESAPEREFPTIQSADKTKHRSNDMVHYDGYSIQLKKGVDPNNFSKDDVSAVYIGGKNPTGHGKAERGDRVSDPREVHELLKALEKGTDIDKIKKIYHSYHSRDKRIEALTGNDSEKVKEEKGESENKAELSEEEKAKLLKDIAELDGDWGGELSEEGPWEEPDCSEEVAHEKKSKDEKTPESKKTDEELTIKAQRRALLEKFGIDSIRGASNKKDGGIIYDTDKCKIEISKDMKTVILRDGEGLWREATFVFDKEGNVQATFTGIEKDGGKEELVINCKEGDHLNKFLNSARLMLEDRDGTSPEDRAKLLQDLLYNTEEKEAYKAVSLSSISNLDLKDLHFIKGYNFKELKVNSCNFDNCSFDVCGKIISKACSFKNTFLVGYAKKNEEGTVTGGGLEFIGLGVNADGLNLRGYYKNSMLLLKEGADKCTAIKMDAELPTFLPEGTTFKYKVPRRNPSGEVMKDSKGKVVYGIKELNVAELLENGDRTTRDGKTINVVNEIREKALNMTKESQNELSASIKKNLRGLIVALNDRNKVKHGVNDVTDMFYSLLKDNCNPIGGKISSVGEFNPSTLLTMLKLKEVDASDTAFHHAFASFSSSHGSYTKTFSAAGERFALSSIWDDLKKYKHGLFGDTFVPASREDKRKVLESVFGHLSA